MELAFVADWDGDWEIYLIRADGTGLSQLTNNET
jgi:Tol biopolymer transport system component